ncbi:hypothetical protein KM043_012025 [Ampulex compressa]|nr:hypothetical protein KM043_012025 [Ampulex compressa]
MVDSQRKAGIQSRLPALSGGARRHFRCWEPSRTMSNQTSGIPPQLTPRNRGRLYNRGAQKRQRLRRCSRSRDGKYFRSEVVCATAIEDAGSLETEDLTLNPSKRSR